MYEIDSYGDGWNGGQFTVEQKSSTGWTPIFTFGMPFHDRLQLHRNGKPSVRETVRV